MSLLPKPSDVPSFPVLVHGHPLRGWLTFMRLAYGPGPWTKEDMDKSADIYFRILARQQKVNPVVSKSPLQAAPQKKKKKHVRSAFIDDEASEEERRPRKKVRRRLFESESDEYSDDPEEDLDGFVVKG